MPEENFIQIGDTVGAADAESDQDFLNNCYVSMPGTEILLDTSKPNSIVLGRTGAGKTALLNHISAQADHVIVLDPHALSLDYITNSNVLRYFESIDVSLDPFYKLLWSHIFVIELIKKKYSIVDKSSLKSFWSKMTANLNPSKRSVLDYFNEWHDKFFQETEIRVRETVQKMEDSLESSVSGGNDYFKVGFDYSKSFSEEEKREQVNRAQAAIIDKVQLSQLNRMLEILNKDIFTDSQSPYYIIIDKLDEEWAEDKVRFNLIRALMVSINQFQKISNVKVIVSLRSDIENTVFRATNSAGFQREKFKSKTIRIKWSRDDLVELIERRINHQFRNRYTKQLVDFNDLFRGEKIDKQKPIEYIISRTLYRPRDCILFLNECLEKATGKRKIDRAIIRSAEQSYSESRLYALKEEWGYEYPAILYLIELLRDRSSPRSISTISDEDIVKHLEGIQSRNYSDDFIDRLLEKYLSTQGNDPGSMLFIRQKIFALFYKLGVVGIKSSSGATRQWSYIDEPTIAPERISSDAKFEIHRAFHRALNINPDTRENSEG